LADPYFVHSSSFVDEGALVGEGTSIWHFCHVQKGAIIGRDCRIGQNVYIGSGAIIGNSVKIQNNVSVYDGVILENHVFCGPSMVFTNVINPRSHIERKREYRKTLVRRGATIGANATILCGITLGEYAFIGAGSVVTRDLPDHALAYGNPAKVKGWVCSCAGKLSFDPPRLGKAVCSACGKNYLKKGRTVREIPVQPRDSRARHRSS
jgi:UDP-2-acetamido-3-amino-2,3-dideoxy-glucuronate N-acetyltransferase